MPLKVRSGPSSRREHNLTNSPGHKLAWERAKLLHRDVSPGNILIVEDPVEGGFYGFLHDFDYSYMEDLDVIVDDERSLSTEEDIAIPSNAALDPTRTMDVSDVNDDLKERTVCQSLSHPRIMSDHVLMYREPTSSWLSTY